MKSTLVKALENIVRNWVTTIPTIMIMAIVLTMFHGLVIVQDNAKKTLEGVSQKFSITIYLKDNTDTLRVGNLISELENRPDVIAPVVYTSKEAAWETMNKSLALDPTLLSKYKFSLPASITITPRRPEDGARIEEYMQAQAPALLQDPTATKEKQKNVTRQMTEFIQNIQNAIERTLLLFIIFFVGGGALLIGSAVHVAITSRHLEMNIMKLVGASVSRITNPFVIEGVLLSLIAFSLHLLLLTILPIEMKNSKLYLNALLFEFAATVALGAISSYITTIFHINRKII